LISSEEHMSNASETSETSDMSETSDPRSAAPRGFAILIVLAVLAMASVILATQLASVEGQQIAQLRSSEEVKARDIAEHCLELADAYVVAFGNNNLDFDLLLDPNGIVEANGDDFLPPETVLPGAATSVVTIPPGRAGSKYRYRAFDIASPGPGGTPGTCFIRYDDNSDDTNPLFQENVTSNTNGVIEGAGVDVPERDRDRTVITTVVGVVPQQPDQAIAYTRAHARATVRRVRAMPIGVDIGAAIEAGGKVDFGGSICGSVAGIVADSIEGGACICGVLNAELVRGSQGTTAGDCGCPTCAASTGSTIGIGPRPDPVVKIPPYGSLLKADAFSVPESLGVNIADPGYPAAVVYARNAAVAPAGYQDAGTTDIFVWDRFDDDTLTTLGTGGATQSCTSTSGLDPLPSPCKWDVGASAVTCEVGESPCWKLVARLGDGPPSGDIDVRGAVIRGEHADASGAIFTPRAGDLPNVKTVAAGGGEWSDFAPGSCAICGGTSAVLVPSGTSYVVGVNALNDTPHMVLTIDTASAATVTVGALSRTGARITVNTNASVAIDGSNQCCATCDCPQACALGTTMTKEANGNGYAIRTNQPCADLGAGPQFGIVGHLMCAQLDVTNRNDNCVVGGLICLGGPPEGGPGTIACDLPGAQSTDDICSASANFCAKNNMVLVGDLQCAGNICLRNNLNMAGGTIETQGSVGWKNNPIAAGQIRAVGDIIGKNNAKITFDGSAGLRENQGVAAAIWIDAAW
jgi:hypothetical protein